MCKNPLDQAIEWVYKHRKVDFDTGCWELDTALLGADGHQQYRIPVGILELLDIPKSQRYLARRFMAIIFLGLDKQSEELIFTKCGNVQCCNYEHLSIGYRKQDQKMECFRCKRFLDIKTEFYWKKDKPFSWCKNCFRDYIKIWNKKQTQKRSTVKRKLDRRSLQKRISKKSSSKIWSCFFSKNS